MSYMLNIIQRAMIAPDICLPQSHSFLTLIPPRVHLLS